MFVRSQWERIILFCVCGWHHVLDHVYSGYTQRQCETGKDIVDNYRLMFESRIFAGAAEKASSSEKLSISTWFYDMEGHVKKCVERFFFLNWQTWRLNNSTKYQLHALMIINSKKKNWNPWQNCQLYLKCFWNVCTWHVSTVLKFYGPSTNLHVQSQNGSEHVSNV